MLSKMPFHLLKLGLVAGMLAACAAQAPVPKDRYYRLSTPDAGTPSITPMQGIVGVDRLRGNGLTQDQPVLAVDRGNPNEVMPFSYHHWIDNPTILIQQSLTDYLRDSNIALKVVTSEMRIRQDYLVSGRIDALEKVSGGSGPTVARLAIEFRVEDLENDQVLLIEDYLAEVPAGNDNWPAVLKAFELALAQVFRDLRDDIAKLPAS